MSFGKLEHELINLLRTGAPDFEAAEKLLAQGANINAQSGDDENVLSEILAGYWWSDCDDRISGDCNHCNKDECDGCEHAPKDGLNPNLGESMCKIIKFFLAHGFDVNRCEGRFGAQCLEALTLSTFDRFMIDATKLLFDAGAKNIPTIPDGGISDTPLSSIGTEGSFQDTCEGNLSLANIYEAVYQIYEAIENNLPYNGIDSYHAAVGKKIIKVLAEQTEDKLIFYTLDLPAYKKEHCFTTKLYFVYDDGALITTEHSDFWVDTFLPNKNLIDVSETFSSIIGDTIISFSYKHEEIAKASTRYGQPITILEMDSGTRVKFSTNFGEVKNEDRAAYFEII